MLGDLRVFDLGDELLLDCERVALQELFNMIRRYKLGRGRGAAQAHAGAGAAVASSGRTRRACAGAGTSTTTRARRSAARRSSR